MRLGVSVYMMRIRSFGMRPFSMSCVTSLLPAAEAEVDRRMAASGSKAAPAAPVSRAVQVKAMPSKKGLR